MTLAKKLAFGNPRIASIVFGHIAAAQFLIEILLFICFAVYAAAPLSLAIKVFYGIAAGFTPIFLLFAILFIFGVSKDDHRWMTPWVFSQALVAIAEFILAIFGFVLLSDLHDILQFYNSAWSLAQQYQTVNQLYIGEPSNCTALFSPFQGLPLGGHGVTFVAFFAQQGAAGWIAFLALLLIFKVAFNIQMFFVIFGYYRDLKQGHGIRKTYGAN